MNSAPLISLPPLCEPPTDKGQYDNSLLVCFWIHGTQSALATTLACSSMGPLLGFQEDVTLGDQDLQSERIEGLSLEALQYLVAG